MIARHPLYTPTTGSRVGRGSDPAPCLPPPPHPKPATAKTFPSPPRQLPDPVQELPGPAGASQSCIDVHRPWRIYVYIYVYIYIYTQSARALGFDA